MDKALDSICGGNVRMCIISICHLYSPKKKTNYKKSRIGIHAIVGELRNLKKDWPQSIKTPQIAVWIGRCGYMGIGAECEPGTQSGDCGGLGSGRRYYPMDGGEM